MASDEHHAAGDRIAAVIRGTAINNDGANRVGFTAPSIDGRIRGQANARAIGITGSGNLRPNSSAGVASMTVAATAARAG